MWIRCTSTNCSVCGDRLIWCITRTACRTVLGNRSYTVAIGLLTEAAVNGGLLTHDTVRCYREMSSSLSDDEEVSVDHVLYSLEHDGYLESVDGGYGFVSGLLEDWWRARHGQYFTPIIDRR